MTLPHLLRPAPLRKRLWQLATLLALVTGIFAVGNAFQTEDKAVSGRMLGHDFLAFYTAGTFVREGRTNQLYDLPAVAEFQQQIAKDANLDITVDYTKQKFGPWWNPPFYAWLFVPFSLLSYNKALAAWTLLNLACLGGAIAMLMRMLVPRWLDHDAMGRPTDWRTTGLVPFLILLSMPFVQAISHGQNSMTSLCLLAGVVTFWRNKRAILAGGLCAALAVKPQLAAVVACGLVISLGYRAILGLCLGGSLIVLFTQFTMPGLLVQYLHVLPKNVHWMQVEHAYLWDRHATLKAFYRMLLQGKAAGEMGWLAWGAYVVSGAILTTLLARAAWSNWRRQTIDDPWSLATERTWRDRLIAATICCAPLLMPFYFDYDLLLLAIPATLLAAEVLARPIDASVTRSERWTTRLWVALYAWMLINPGMTGLTRLNGNVILLSGIAILMIRRAHRPAAKVAKPVIEPQRVDVRRAA